MEVLRRVLFRLCYLLPHKTVHAINQDPSFGLTNVTYLVTFSPLNDRKVTETLFRISPASLSVRSHGFFFVKETGNISKCGEECSQKLSPFNAQRIINGPSFERSDG